MNGAAGRIDRRLRTVRLRLTATAVVVVAVILVVTGVVLVVQQRSRLTGVVDAALRSRADLVEQDPTADAVLVVADLEDHAAQVVDATGAVVAASLNLAGAPPVAPPPDGTETVRTVSDLPIEDDRYRVLSRRVDGGLVVHVAENIDDIDDNVRGLIRALLVAFPLVLGALAAATWWFVGAVLRPVRAATLRQERFVSDASHELRGPLARMRARLEVDLAYPEGVDLRETVGEVLDDALALERLADDLLHLARHDAGVVDRPRDDLVDLDDLLLDEAAAAGARPTLDVDVSRVSGARVRGDRTELVRLVRNLVDNAARHATSTVRLTLEETTEGVRLVVEDDGPGIPPGDRQAVFDRFTQLDEARTRVGTGLGLAIVREVVEAHGGSIGVEESGLGGASFEVVLPTVS